MTNAENENILRAIDALRVVQDFLIAGKCPPGVRPFVLERLADILAYDEKALSFPVWTRRITGKGFDILTNDEVYAARMKKRGYCVQPVRRI
jgi:hypothetical protein